VTSDYFLLLKIGMIIKIYLKLLKVSAAGY